MFNLFLPHSKNEYKSEYNIISSSNFLLSDVIYDVTRALLSAVKNFMLVLLVLLFAAGFRIRFATPAGWNYNTD